MVNRDMADSLVMLAAADAAPCDCYTDDVSRELRRIGTAAWYAALMASGPHDFLPDSPFEPFRAWHGPMREGEQRVHDAFEDDLCALADDLGEGMGITCWGRHDH